jgi:hypothetical protein
VLWDFGACTVRKFCVFQIKIIKENIYQIIYLLNSHIHNGNHKKVTSYYKVLE